VSFSLYLSILTRRPLLASTYTPSESTSSLRLDDAQAREHLCAKKPSRNLTPFDRLALRVVGTHSGARSFLSAVRLFLSLLSIDRPGNMKASIALLAVATATSVAASGSHLHHHHHRHHHLAKREAEVVTVDGPTVYVYKLGDKLIDQNEACEGIKEGSLAFTGEELPEDACSPKTSPAAGGQFFEKPSAPIEKPKPKPTPEAPKPPPPPPKPVVPEVEDIVEDILGGGGLDSDFPDGKLDCSEFPSKYGPLKLDYLGIGGWSGIQYVSGGAGGYSSIHTAIKGDKCKDGAMCSYACPPGYQKSQWPQAQGVNGESIGGIECRGGKLYLTNPKYKKLCISGSGGVQVQNTMSEIAAICRTDYPGKTERRFRIHYCTR
jgi:hypothetical protein